MSCPKNLIWRRKNEKLRPDEKIPCMHGLGTLRQFHGKKKWPISDDFGLRSPVIQKPFQTKRGIPLYLYRSKEVYLCTSIIEKIPLYLYCSKEVYLYTFIVAKRYTFIPPS